MKKSLIAIICLLTVLLAISACSDKKKPAALPEGIKAVYLAPQSESQLPAGELENYPQVLVVNSFDDIKMLVGSSDKKMGIWIDSSSVNMADKEWLLEEPQKYYPVLLIGCYDVVSPTPMRESFYSDSINWNSKTLQKGFSYWVVRASEGFPSEPEYMEGIDTLIKIDEMLRVTDDLITGNSVPEKMNMPTPGPKVESSSAGRKRAPRQDTGVTINGDYAKTFMGDTFKFQDITLTSVAITPYSIIIAGGYNDNTKTGYILERKGDPDDIMNSEWNEHKLRRTGQIILRELVENGRQVMFTYDEGKKKGCFDIENSKVVYK